MDTSSKRAVVTIPKVSNDVWTLSNIAHLAGLEHCTTKALGPLPLQPYDKGRNVPWYTANAAQIRTLRLEFELMDDARKTFSGWLGSLQKKFELINVSVVLKNTMVCRYTATSDIAISRGEIFIRLDLEQGSVAFSAILSLGRHEVTLRLQRDKGADGRFTLANAVDWLGKPLIYGVWASATFS